MGSMSDMVSQFEVDDIYSQINYKDRPVRVSPLKYANLIKWFTNRRDGLPAYIRIDMASQTTEMVKLEQRNEVFDQRAFWKKYLPSSSFCASDLYLRETLVLKLMIMVFHTG